MTDSVVINGMLWRVVRAPAGDPRLYDRTGTERLGTADPHARVIAYRSDLVPPMLDRVVLHEVAHAVAVSWGLTGGVREPTPCGDADEWLAQTFEGHAVEAVRLAGRILGRPVCIGGECA